MAKAKKTDSEFLNASFEGAKDKAEAKEIDYSVFEMENRRKLDIKSVKIKYIQSGDFGYYKMIGEIGVLGVMGYSDGDIVLKKFLSAVFDKKYTETEVKDDETEKYSYSFEFDPFVEDLLNEMSIEDMDKLVLYVKKKNKIPDTENFQKAPQTE